ncbi:MAG: hypothetical protein NTY23_07175 [Chloroflexi bacterium]|nr:hypothetical protein [Chloroflexota bacterium]
MRVIYVHGAWVWAAIIGFGLAALAGLIGLVSRSVRAQAISLAWGWAATLAWVTSLPLSLWAMQTSWNGLLLEEPRWRLGVQFAVVAVLLQAALLVIARPALGSLLNLAFFIALVWGLRSAQAVMHPMTALSSSESIPIRLVSALMLALALGALWQVARLVRPRGHPAA